MHWAVFEIIATFLWSFVNIVDKYALGKWFKNLYIPIIILEILGIIAAVIIYLFHGFAELSVFSIFIALIAGIFHFLCYVFYFKAVKLEEISRVVPLFHFTPVFVLIFGTFLLGEIFTPIKYFGIFLILIGAVGLSFKNSIKLNLGKAFWLMILSSISWAVFSISLKYLLNFSDFWTVFAYTRIGAVFALIPAVYFTFNDFKSLIRKQGLKPVAVVSIAHLFNLAALILATVAVSLGPVILVEFLSSTQYLFLFFITIFLSIFYPSIIKEDIGRFNVIIKFAAIMLMILGSVLIV